MEELFICLSLTLIQAAAGQFQVHTQDKSLVAEVGSDVILPCTISPPLPSVGLEVRWFRDLFHNIVFLLQNGREDRQQQSADYRGRVSLLAGPENGNLSLSLHKVRLSDTGKYHCFVESAIHLSDEEGVMELSVVAFGTPPLISVTLDGNLVVVSCSSDEWFPQPAMFWMKENKDLGPAETKTSKNASSGLFHIQSNIHLKHPSDGLVYCGLRHPVTQKETGVYVSISDAMFPRASSWAIAFWLLFFVTVVVFGLVAWFFYSKQKEKERQLKEKEDFTDSLQQEIEWRKISVVKETVSFDPLTAYCGLLISPDGRTISTTDVVQDVPSNPERFDTEPCVLAQTAFQSGTHYWETEITEHSGKFWSLGIAGQSVRRTGGQRECPKSFIWAIRATKEGYYGLSTPPEPIMLFQEADPEPKRTQRVGTYLDYDKGMVSFYDVDTYRHLYTFKERFSEPVYPFHYVGPGIAFSL